MSKAEEAAALMHAHRVNCAQSVMSVFCEQMGLDLDTGLRVAMAFGGGMGRGGNTCGAVTGAYMALGLSQKISPDNPRESIDKTYGLVRKFNEKFIAKHGSLLCRELLGCDMSQPGGIEEARDKNLFANICLNLVHSAVQIAEDLI
ncbi:C-GCAxxG-C-C family protein [Chloroflexota bacterium]